MPLPNRTAALLMAALIPAAAGAGETYGALILGSRHIGNDTLNNVTPGLTFGHRRATSLPGTEVFAEGGVFYNSYEEVSPLAIAGLSRRVTQLGPAEIRIGGAVGTAYYAELSERLEERYGIPNLGGFIPLAALSLSARVGEVDVRLTTVPPDTDITAIFNLSVAFTF